jgi:hypothetical protein
MLIRVFKFVPITKNLLVEQRLIINPSRSHSDTPQSVRLLWTSYQPEAQTSTWQHRTLAWDRLPYIRWDSNKYLSKQLQQTHALDRLVTGTECLWKHEAEMQVTKPFAFLIDLECIMNYAEYIEIFSLLRTKCCAVGMSRNHRHSQRRINMGHFPNSRNIFSFCFMCLRENDVRAQR